MAPTVPQCIHLLEGEIEKEGERESVTLTFVLCFPFQVSVIDEQAEVAAGGRTTKGRGQRCFTLTLLHFCHLYSSVNCFQKK